MKREKLTRDGFITDLWEQECRRYVELETEDVPREGYQKELQECSDRLDILTQMIDENPMNYISKDKLTGSMRQVFVGTLDGQPEVYLNCKNHEDKYYYARLITMNYGDEEFYKDVRLLKLANKVWSDWFEKGKYEREKEKRAEDGIYIRVTVIDGTVTKIQWFEPEE